MEEVVEVMKKSIDIRFQGTADRDRAPQKSVRRAVGSLGRETIIGVIFSQISPKPLRHYSDSYDRYHRR